ncbi:MAG: OsmC family protein [Chloroflexota bacterium]
MAQIERRANASWEGDLPKGTGIITSVTSGVLENLPVTWASRVERSNGKTSPEELIAAAQASCYAMALANTLAGDGTVAEHLDVTAVCGADTSSGALKITTMDITVKGQVPGLDQAAFEAVAQRAEQGCPVAGALRNNLSITIHAELAQTALSGN